nr:TPA_asm: m162 uoORF [Murid betaherpesvirus 1]DBA08141.1 TPA_asm: m162 uoORF [Murid betaherpesvirus 1]
MVDRGAKTQTYSAVRPTESRYVSL